MPFIDPRSGPSYGALDHEERYSNEERDALLSPEVEAQDSRRDAVETPEEFQEGVRKIEAINLTWTTRSLVIAYIRSVCPSRP